jgi:uncharacterized lipoprotein YmbA
MNRIITILLALLLLTSCASESVTIKYYKLGGLEKTLTGDHSVQEATNQPLILIEPIQLTDFLRQPGLVIQKTNHQIQISNIHRWAEDLQRASSRIIRQQLEGALPEYRFENQSAQWKAKPLLRLTIELEQFHIINHQKQVITSGQFWLFDNNNSLLLKKAFSFEESLNQNGYEHAVSRLERVLHKLSKQIADDLQKSAEGLTD